MYARLNGAVSLGVVILAMAALCAICQACRSSAPRHDVALSDLPGDCSSPEKACSEDVADCRQPIGSGDCIDNTSEEIVSDGTALEDQVDLNCTPDCEGMECGDDGCGGSCGQCPCEDCEDFQVWCTEGLCIGEMDGCCGLFDCVANHEALGDEALAHCLSMMSVEPRMVAEQLLVCWQAEGYPDCWRSWFDAWSQEEVCPQWGSLCEEEVSLCCPALGTFGGTP
jgi:hypothetical protein